MYPVADPAAIDMLKRMLTFDPSRRATAESVCAHTYFADMAGKEFMAAYLNQKIATGDVGPDGAPGSPLYSSPVPMNPDIESIGEDKDNLKFNVNLT